MINNQMLLGSQAKKDNILNIFNSKSSKEDLSFQKTLNESMNSKNKEDIKAFSLKEWSKTNVSSNKKTQNKIVDDNDNKELKSETLHQSEILESLEQLFIIIQSLDSSEVDINFNEVDINSNNVEINSFEKAEELLNNISFKLLSGEKVINQKDLEAIVDIIGKLENSNLNFDSIISGIKDELKNHLNQLSMPAENNQLKIKASDESISSNVNNNINAELEKSWQGVLDEQESLRENLTSENKSSKLENEARVIVKNEQPLIGKENKNILNLSNPNKDIIGEEGIPIKDLKSVTFSGIEAKQDNPIQKQMFNNILDQVNKAHIHVRENDSEMHLQLKPDNLGSLSLKIAIEKGIVVAKIVAENQIVKETLESNFNLLKDSLNQKGLGIQELSVSVGQDPNFKNRNSFQQFKRFKNMKINNTFNTVDDISLSNFNNSSRLQSSSIDFLA